MNPNPSEVTMLRLMGMIARQHRSNSHLLLMDQDVHPGQPPVLFELSRNDGLRQSELAERIRIKPATVTVMLNRMVKNGHVERRVDSKDQRVSRVYLTDKGRAAVDQVREALQISEEHALEGLSPEERMLMRRLLHHMFDNVKKHEQLIRQLTKGEEE